MLLKFFDMMSSTWVIIKFKGARPPSLLYNFKFKYLAASGQNMKNLIGNFGAIHVGIIHAKFLASSFTGVGGEWGDRRTRDLTPFDPYAKFLNSPLRFGRDKWLSI